MLSSRTILLADHQPEFAQQLSELSEKIGVALQVVDEGRKVKDRALSLRPNLVVLSGELPGINGYLLVKQLRECSELAQTKFTLVSSRADALDVFANHQKLPSKADFYMRKPLSKETFLGMLDELWDTEYLKETTHNTSLFGLGSKENDRKLESEIDPRSWLKEFKSSEPAEELMIETITDHNAKENADINQSSLDLPGNNISIHTSEDASRLAWNNIDASVKKQDSAAPLLNSEVEKLEDVIRYLRDENEGLKQVVVKLKEDQVSRASELTALQEKLSSFSGEKEEVSKLKGELAETQKYYRDALETLNKIKNENSSMNEELTILQASKFQFNRLFDERNKLKEEKLLLEGRFVALQNENEVVHKDLEEIKTQTSRKLNELTEKNREYLATLSDQSRQLAEAIDKYSNLESKNSEDASEMRRVQSALENMKEAIAKKDELIAKLREENFALANQKSRMDMTLEELNYRVSDLEALSAEWESRQKEVVQKYNALVAQYKSLKTKHIKDEQAFLQQSELLRKLKRLMSQMQMGTEYTAPKIVAKELEPSKYPGVQKPVAAPAAASTTTKPAVNLTESEITLHFDEFID